MRLRGAKLGWRWLRVCLAVSVASGCTTQPVTAGSPKAPARSADGGTTIETAQHDHADVLPATHDGAAAETDAAVEAPSPSSPVVSSSPSYQPTFEEALACRKRHCYTQAPKKCFDTCYKYNHPNGPAHDQCNQNCRRNYDIPNCEAACEKDRLAFASMPAALPKGCRDRMAECRATCEKWKGARCESTCLDVLRSCESLATPK